MKDLYKLEPAEKEEGTLSKCKHFIGDCCNPYLLVLTGGAALAGYGVGSLSSLQTDFVNYGIHFLGSAADGKLDSSFSLEASKQLAHEVGLRSMAVYSSIAYLLGRKIIKRVGSFFERKGG